MTRPHAFRQGTTFRLHAVRRHVGNHLDNWSLRLRLLIFFTLFLVCVWLLIALFSWRENRKYIDEFFDTQQTVFAKTLLTADLSNLNPRLPKTKDLLRGIDKEARGSQDKNALGFAVFDADGNLLLDDGEKGKHFIYDGWTRGFSDSYLEKGKKPWRLVWLTSRDGSRIVAVGQELKYRNAMAMNMLLNQILPWIMLLPLLLGGLFWMLSRELAPIREVADTLETRSARDAGPLKIRRIPSEVRPLVKALNALFARVASMLERERSFVADAAHELRTPLTGLRVQTEVLALADEDPEERTRTINHMLMGIDRCSRLVEQLLTLSRLESISEADADKKEETGQEFLDWSAIVREAIDAFRFSAEKKNLTLRCSINRLPKSATGYPQLLSVLLRNLLDNAVKYTPEGGTIHITLESRALTIENSGQGIAPTHLARLGERFFRPPGQEETGSGLGLSIVRRIAELHGFIVEMHNKIPTAWEKPSGFVVGIAFPERKNKSVC